MKTWKRTRRKLRGLGDAVAIVAQPIARAIDAVAGTDIEHCQGCKQRQETLNAAVPFGPQPPPPPEEPRPCLNCGRK